MRKARWSSRGLRAAALVLVACVTGTSAERANAQPTAAEAAGVFTIADGGFTLEAPAGWERVQPKSGMIETEFAVPAAEGAAAGRLTVMGAGGSIEANVDRWCGQFSQPDGSATRDKTTTKKLQVAGCEVTLVDISGTFKDMPGGPFAGGAAVERPGYRMLAAIVATPGRGNYFLKLTGPAATIAGQEAGFRTMVEGLVATGQ